MSGEGRGVGDQGAKVLALPGKVVRKTFKEMFGGDLEDLLDDDVLGPKAKELKERRLELAELERDADEAAGHGRYAGL